MITHLSIRGLAVIEELRIDFSPRLNVITGETGAGKSILIKALHLLLGSKADPDVIRAGFERAQVAASFLLPKSHGSIRLLEEHGLFDGEQDLCQLIIRREINQKGRSQAWLNDQPISSSFLKEVGQTLVDIYGQHENHRMLDSSTHIEYVDQFLNDQGLVPHLHALMGQIQSGVAELRKRLEEFQNKRREHDYLQFRYDEIAQFQPSREDFEKITEVCQRASRSGAEQKILTQAQFLCDEAYQGKPISAAIQDLAKLLEQSKWIKEEKKILQDIESLREFGNALDDLSFQIGRVADRNVIDAFEVETTQGRIAVYQSLFRKLGVRNIEEMMLEFQRLEQELAFVVEAPDLISGDLIKISKFVSEAEKISKKLSAMRRKTVVQTISLITKELHDLNMRGAQIEFDFQMVKNPLQSLDFSDFSSDIQKIWSTCSEFLAETAKFGREKGQFLLAANPGEGFKPLAKVASGGEISRIMLGFKKALAVGANTCVMVFDEIDTGISGHTAHIVGRKLKELSENFQVICISHLPQVAAYGDSHFRVEKSQKSNSTESRIYRLTAQESEEEIARLLSGDQVTSSSLTHARQLVQSAKDSL